MTASASFELTSPPPNNGARREPLSLEAERDLAERYRRGDRAAGHRLIEANLGFVVNIAREYRRWGIPMEDIIQQGNLGLMKAVDRFEPERGYRLVTYASYWIRAEIREYVVRAYRMVRIGTTKRERRALRFYRTSREDDPEKLAEMSGLSKEDAERLLPTLSAREMSLDAPMASGAMPFERVPSMEATPEEHLLARDNQRHTRAVVDELVSTLSPREQLIAQSRWLVEEPVTLERLGQELGVSKERVRQLEARMANLLRGKLQGGDEDPRKSPTLPPS